MLTQDDRELQSHLWSLSLPDAIKAFNDLTRDGTDKNAMRTLCRVSLFYLITQILRLKEYIHPWSYARVLEVDQEPNGCVDLWARGHGKSTIITLAKTIQDLIVVDDVAVLIFSHTYTKVKKHSIAIKSVLETNEVLKELFPERFYKDPKKESPKWTENEFFIKRSIVRKEASVKAVGFDRSLPTGDHADILVFDDVVTEESVTTSDQVEKSKDRFSATKPLGTMNSVERIIGTRYSWDDLFQSIIDARDDQGEPTYKVRCYPATITGELPESPEDLVMFTWDAWLNKTSAPTTAKMVACQYLLNPLSAEDRIFNIKNVEVYEVRPQRLNVCILVDPASSKKKGSCDTAMVVLGIGGKKRKYLLDGFCQKMTLVEKYQKLQQLHSKWRAEAGIHNIVIGYETYGAGEDQLQYIEEMMKRNRYPMKIVELQAPGGAQHVAKNARIERLQPDIDTHQIFLPYPTDPMRLTSAQRSAQKSGNSALISRPIKRMNHLRESYDLSGEFLTQLGRFPITPKKDLLDAFSRIYDMEVTDPTVQRGSFALDPSELV